MYKVVKNFMGFKKGDSFNCGSPNHLIKNGYIKRVEIVCGEKMEDKAPHNKAVKPPRKNKASK